MQYTVWQESIPPIDELKKAVRRTTLGFGAFFFAYVASSLLISLFVGAFAPQWANQNWFNWVMSVLPLYGIGLPVLLKVIWTVPTNELQKKTLSALDLLLLLPMSVALMIAGSMIANVLMSYLGQIFPLINQTDPVSDAFGDSDLLFMVILTVVVAPIMEEFTFRKLLLDRVHPLGEGVSILLSGVLFGAMHGNLYQFFYATLLGMFLAFIYLKTGRMIYTVLLHMLVNLLCGVMPTLVSGDLLSGLGENAEEIVLTVPLVKGLWRMLGYVMAEYALAIVGVALFFVFYREMRSHINPSLLKPFKQFEIAFLNVGTLLMFAISFGLVCLNLFA